MFEAWTLRKEAVANAEENLRESVRRLSDQERAEYFRIYNNKLKDPDTYAVLNYFFLAGLHHFYLRKYLRGLFNLLVMTIGLAALFLQSPLGLIALVFIAAVELPALFRSQIVVEHHNIETGREILDARGSATQSIAGIE